MILPLAGGWTTVPPALLFYDSVINAVLLSAYIKSLHIAIPMVHSMYVLFGREQSR